MQQAPVKVVLSECEQGEGAGGETGAVQSGLTRDVRPANALSEWPANAQTAFSLRSRSVHSALSCLYSASPRPH